MENSGMDPEPADYSVNTKCPRCGSEKVVIEEDKEEGYFYVSKCNNCGYKKGDKIEKKEVVEEESHYAMNEEDASSG